MVAPIFVFGLTVALDALPSGVPKRLRIELEEATDRAMAQCKAREKIKREDADRRRLIDRAQAVVDSGCELLIHVASLPSGRALRKPTAGRYLKRSPEARQGVSSALQRSVDIPESGVVRPGGVLSARISIVQALRRARGS